MTSSADSTAENEPNQGLNERARTRSDLLPEEQHAGSDDAERQAQIILEDSDERTARPEETQRASVQTPDPDDAAKLTAAPPDPER